MRLSLADFLGSGQHFTDDQTHVLFRRAVVDDAGAQRELIVDGCVGEIDASAADDTIEDCPVQAVQVPPRAAVAEADGAERNGARRSSSGSASIDFASTWASRRSSATDSANASMP